MYHRHLGLVTRVAQIINRAKVEEAAIADSRQVKLGNRFRRQREERAERVSVLSKPVIGEKRVVREQDAIPAPYPFIVQCELALGVNSAAELSITRLPREIPGLQLVDAIGADLV